MSQQLLQSRGMATEPSAQITLDAQIAQLGRLEHWVNKLAAQFAWPPSLLHRVDLCLTELVTNVISYGYADGNAGDGHAGTIGIRLWVQSGQIVVRIDDDGTAFDPTAHVLPSLPVSLADAAGDGRGIRLVRHFADELHYVRCASGNQLTLIFRETATASGRDSGSRDSASRDSD